MSSLQGPQTTTATTTTTTTVRGGWSTSICDLFADPSNRSNCCALACCGVLLHDKNAHLLQQLSPQNPSSSSSSGSNRFGSSGWNRLLVYVGIPLSVMGLLLILRSSTIGNKEDSPGNNVHGKVVMWNVIIAITFVVLVVVLSLRARYERIQLRRAILTKLYHYQQEHANTNNNSSSPATTTEENEEEKEEDSNDQGADPLLVTPPNQAIARRVAENLTVESYLQLQMEDTHAAHGVCGCFRNDRSLQLQQSLDLGEETLEETTEKPKDFCTALFHLLSRLCCGCFCDNFLQCCGLCALGQEHRQLQLLLLEEEKHRLLQTDYITHQPFTDYYPLIEQLRADQSHSIYQHSCNAISRLSKQLVRILGVAIALAAVVSVTPFIEPGFGIKNLAVMLGTLSQGFLVVLLVWCCSKFDLSFDAVIKYFASGFCLCTFMALLYEIVAQILVGVVTNLIVAFGIANEFDPTNTDPRQMEKLAKHFPEHHIAIFAVIVFINAFVVAALIEELVKYFGYYMVETPDIMEQDNLVTAEQEEDDDEHQNQDEERGAPLLSPGTGVGPLRSLVSRGAAITIGLVSVAAGFACSENIVYVFFYSPPGLGHEVQTLLLRSLFPIHPLCAAIQSVGVVQRDIEQDKNYGIGRIILPAVLLHGAFDFVLMLMALIQASQKPDSDDDQAKPTDGEPLGPLDFIALGIAASLAVLGILYYILVARYQRKRLQAMDQQQQRVDAGTESEPALALSLLE